MAVPKLSTKTAAKVDLEKKTKEKRAKGKTKSISKTKIGQWDQRGKGLA